MSKRKKIKETIDTTPIPVADANSTEWEFYLDLKANQMAPSNSQSIERVGFKLYTWALETPNALKVSQFAHLNGISMDTFMYWYNRHEKFKAYYNAAKRILGDRREVGAINRIYDPGMIRSSMAFYDPEWLEAEERRAKQADGIAGKGNVTVVMQSFDEDKK